jgi:hypothetical protein
MHPPARWDQKTINQKQDGNILDTIGQQIQGTHIKLRDRLTSGR